MKKIPEPDEFLRMVRGEKEDKSGDEKKREEKRNPYTKMGKVASVDEKGRPSIIFDGEEQPSVKHYPYLAGYTPTVGDRVLLVVAGNTYVVVGKIV